MPLHLNTSVCCLLPLLLVLLLSSAIVPSSGSFHGQLFSVRPTPPPTELLDTPGQGNVTQPGWKNLIGTKLGLAVAFFFAVLLPCGLPVLVIHWLQKSTSSPTSSSVEQARKGDEVGAEANHCLPDTSGSTAIGLGDSAANQVHSNPSLGLETVDLLTGQPLQGYPGRWRQRSSLVGEGVAPSTTTADNNQQAMDRWCLHDPPRSDARRREQRKRLLKMWFSRCNCFAAGIFLSSGFMELYPDVEEAIDHAVKRLSIDTDFPFAPFLTLVGFFFVLSIEQIVLTVKSRRDRQHATAAPAGNQQSNGLSGPLAVGNHSSTCSPVNSNSDEENKLSPRSDYNVEVFELDDLESSSPTRLLPPASPGVTFNGQRTSRPGPVGGQDSSHDRYGHHDHFGGITVETDSFTSVLRVILLLCAMSLHSLFEGLAVGLQTSVTRAVGLFSAILLHKIIIALGIGFNLATLLGGSEKELQHHHEEVESGEKSKEGGSSSFRTQSSTSKNLVLQQTLGTLILASSSPLGVLIGLVLTTVQQSSALMLTTAVLQGLSCGTFFYVVFCELLPEEFREGVSDRLVKLLFLVLGFLVITGYSVAMPE